MNSQDNTSTFATSKDFQSVLNALLTAYRPILENELKLASSADTLLKEAAAHPPTCEDEIQLANEPFFTRDVAVRLLPDEGCQVLGNQEQWAWCYRRILCCLTFGWLVCRGPRTLRGFAYYLH